MCKYRKIIASDAIRRELQVHKILQGWVSRKATRRRALFINSSGSIGMVASSDTSPSQGRVVLAAEVCDERCNIHTVMRVCLGEDYRSDLQAGMMVAANFTSHHTSFLLGVVK
jgi:hypothetical protein